MPSRAAERAPARRRATVLAGGVLVLAFLALLIYGLTARAVDDRIDSGLSQAEPVPAPGFDLAVLQRGRLGPFERRLRGALADDRVTLAELRGQPVVLNFWASWCIPCRQEAPLLERTWRAQRARGVLFVGLNVQDLTGDARSFLREFHNTYLNIRYPGKTVYSRYGLTGVPETFFITARGKVVGHVIGVASAAKLAGGIRAARTSRVGGVQVGGEQRSAGD